MNKSKKNILLRIVNKIRNMEYDPNIVNNHLLIKDVGIKKTFCFLCYNIIDYLDGYRTNFYQRSIEKFIENEFSDIEVCSKFVQKSIKKKCDVWVLWLQGRDNAPDLIKICLKSHEKYIDNEFFEYHLITNENLCDFVTIPYVIDEKFKNGQISFTHFSDIIRVLLLNRYGGIWMDATLLLTEKIPRNILEYEFYTNRKETTVNNNNRLVSKGRWTSYFLYCKCNNPLISYMCNAFEHYWKNHNVLVDYWLVDYTINSAYKKSEIVKQQIDNVPYNNQYIVGLHKLRNEKYEKSKFDELLKENTIHKLSYKDITVKYDIDGNLTYWGAICERILGEFL